VATGDPHHGREQKERERIAIATDAWPRFVSDSLVHVPSHPTQAQSGLLGRLSLRTPGSSTPVATQTAPIGSGAISVSHTVTDTELALTSNWTCEVTNNADTPIEFITDISNSVGGGGLEPVASIMGYYDKSGVPVYDYLAAQFTVCDGWFASIPTDTFPNRLYAMTGGAGGLLTTPPARRKNWRADRDWNPLLWSC
jgi:hypothetical protein